MSRQAPWRIAVIHHGGPSSPAMARLRDALYRHGLVEPCNCAVDAVGVEGRWTQLPLRIGQLLHRRPDVLLAIGGMAALAAQRATARVPILHAVVLDPAAIGLAGPNVSGITTFDPEQANRHLRLLRQLVPGLRRLACLTDADAPRARDGVNPLSAALHQTAAAHGLTLTSADVPQRDADLADLWCAFQRARAQALVALEVPGVLARLGPIASAAERLGLPTLFPYGGSHTGLVMRGAALADAIDPLAARTAALFHGARVADLALHTVRNERLVVDRVRARRTGLSIPPEVIARATGLVNWAGRDRTN